MPLDTDLNLNSIINKNIKSRVSLSGFLAPFNLFLIKEILKYNKKALFVVSDEQTALKKQKDLKNLLDIDSSIFPMAEIGFYSELEKNYYIYQEQLDILLNKPDVVITNVKSLLEKFPSEKFYLENSIELKKNDETDYSSIAQKLIDLGYKRTPQINDIGEFALRGDILDIYTLSDNPCRIEFFADTIEDIREFNPINQKSFSHKDKITIYPLYKFILNEKNRENFKTSVDKIKTKEDFSRKIKEELKEKVEQEGYFEGIEYYINYFSKDFGSVLEYFKDYILIFDETSQILSKYQNLNDLFLKSYNDALATNLKLPLKSLNHTTYEEFSSLIKKFQLFGLDNFLDEDVDKIVEFNLALPPFFSSDITSASKFIKKYLNEGYRIYICSNFPSRLKEIFDELEIFSNSIFYLPDISQGGIWEEKKIVILTDKELFNKRQRDITAKKYYSNKQSQSYIDSINDINTGEYVVHKIHGIGIYNGITKQELDGNKKDYLEIQFQGTDKLFMPAEQINLLSRYRGSSQKPALSKMGGSSWENTKAKTKKELELIAYDLLDLYAKRKMAQGIAFEPDTNWQFEMEDNFEYIETPDQLQAIVDTKADMEENKPMDRLICADVGFGKTEIALRAMFKAVMSGYQSAIIAPTTILTMQHYETIKERFEPYDVRIGLLNRFCAKKDQKKIIEKINSGEIDVVIATHRLLSDDIEFKKLGLLVVDEEHKFGVRQKEKLKKYRENIDILSLSATPIPRTLNMALSGLKDMSVINTPPKNRLPVKTYVGEFSQEYVKNAINQEIQRDGQIYYLYNRVETIERFKDYLEQIVPNARIAIAHGQMSEKLLEETMCRFEKRDFDILLCTTIIESGLDIPNANTIIIHDAVNFGLAQLYQLRGRVGRSEKQAYCFCFYKKSGILNEQAQKRLESIKSFTNLGSGYQIALRDIEIRGVGNLLGTHQHGRMAAVGFDTYCNLLKECIDDIKQKRDRAQNLPSKPIKRKEDTIVDISADAYIPDDWAQTYEQKIMEYKRLSDVQTTDELDEMKVNFKDRFGNIPNCVENLIKLIRLRILASDAGITQVRDTGGTIRIYTPFSLPEWKILKSKIEGRIVRNFSFTQPPKNLSKTKGILLINKNEDNFDEIFNKLADLFYHVSQIVLNYKA